MSKIRVLFLCTGNSARSQMSEALLRKHAGDRFEVCSAGLEPKEIHPLTIRVLEEIGIDTSQLYAKPLSTFLGKAHFDYLITVCSSAEKNCPFFPGVAQRLHWDLEDPAAFQADEAAALQKFRQIRDQIDLKIRQWLDSQVNLPTPSPEGDQSES